MAGSGVNCAVTTDGDHYNKLQRPDDFPTTANKRKRDQDEAPDEPQRIDEQSQRPRARAHGTSRRGGHAQEQRGGDMRAALPGLDDEHNVPGGITDDALAYLRSVRSEADAIPHTLSSHDALLQRDRDAANESSHDVLYQDGAFIADLRLQRFITRRILKRFNHLRCEMMALQTDPQEKMDDTLETKLEFVERLELHMPQQHEVIYLSERAILGRLVYCTHQLRNQEIATISSSFTCWMWTLLALLGDVGTLDSAKVSRVRELGRELGRLAQSIGDDSEDDSEDDSDDEDDHDQEPEQRTRSEEQNDSVHHESTGEDAQAWINMILTVIVEYYGQSDLRAYQRF